MKVDDDFGSGRFDERLRHLPLSRSGDRAPRFRISVSVTLTIHHSPLNCRSINISRTGILLEMSGHSFATRLTPGTVVGLNISPDGYYIRSILSISATVIRVEQTGSAPQIALCFIPEQQS